MNPLNYNNLTGNLQSKLEINKLTHEAVVKLQNMLIDLVGLNADISETSSETESVKSEESKEGL